MAKKPRFIPLSEMTDEEQIVELERRREEEAKDKARIQRLRDTGFYEWRGRNDTENYGDAWLAGYDKALQDAAETVAGLDTPSPELQDVIAEAIRNIKEG